MKYLVALCIGVVALATMSQGCSPPEGGYVEPTEAKMVHFSDHLLLGTVAKLISPDPFYGDQFDTYGATVQVWCTYKGGVFGDTITIHGAGFIPGHCTAKPLEQDKRYIIFLKKKEATDTSYEQTYPAQVFTLSEFEKYRSICGLEIRYPQENGITLPKKECPAPYKRTTCQRYQPDATKDPKKLPVPSVEVRIRDGNDNTTTESPGDSSSTVTTSMLLLALCSLVARII